MILKHNSDRPPQWAAPAALAGRVPAPQWGTGLGSNWCPACWLVTQAQRCAAMWMGTAVPGLHGHTGTTHCSEEQRRQKNTIQFPHWSYDTNRSYITPGKQMHHTAFELWPTVQCFSKQYLCNKKFSQNATCLVPLRSVAYILWNSPSASLWLVNFHLWETLCQAQHFFQSTLICTSYYFLHIESDQSFIIGGCVFSVSNCCYQWKNSKSRYFQ